MSKIVKGDHVIVLAGKDKGKQGQVLRVLDGAVVVDGVNIVKKHQRPNPARQVDGGIFEKNMPLAVSNVAIFNPETKKADRVGIRLVEKDGKVRKIRVFKSTGSEIGG